MFFYKFFHFYDLLISRNAYCLIKIIIGILKRCQYTLLIAQLIDIIEAINFNFKISVE